MRIFGSVDGTIDRLDRPLLFICPFDGAYATYTTGNLRRRAFPSDTRRGRAVSTDERRDRSPTTSAGWR